MNAQSLGIFEGSPQRRQHLASVVVRYPLDDLRGFSRGEMSALLQVERNGRGAAAHRVDDGDDNVLQDRPRVVNLLVLLFELSRLIDRPLLRSLLTPTRTILLIAEVVRQASVLVLVLPQVARDCLLRCVPDRVVRRLTAADRPAAVLDGRRVREAALGRSRCVRAARLGAERARVARPNGPVPIRSRRKCCRGVLLVPVELVVRLRLRVRLGGTMAGHGRERWLCRSRNGPSTGQIPPDRSEIPEISRLSHSCPI